MPPAAKKNNNTKNSKTLPKPPKTNLKNNNYQKPTKTQLKPLKSTENHWKQHTKKNTHT